MTGVMVVDVDENGHAASNRLLADINPGPKLFRAVDDHCG